MQNLLHMYFYFKVPAFFVQFLEILNNLLFTNMFESYKMSVIMQ